MADATVTGEGVPAMKLLAARLKEADPELKKELRRSFRDAAAPLAREVQQSILSMPSKHGGTLREEVARTVVVRTSFSAKGVRVQINSQGSKMPEGKQTLPRHMDSKKGWKHPVYGRRADTHPGGHGRAWTWIKTPQYGKPGWFEDPIAENARTFRDAALAAIDAVEKKLGA